MKSLDSVFKIKDNNKFGDELRRYCAAKKREFKQPLTEAESVFNDLVRFGGLIAGDGFISIFNQFFTPASFSKVCDALTEVGGLKLRDLLREAWSIYTKDRDPITVEQLQSISVRRFNSKERMDRFDEIGLEVEAEIQRQYETDNIYCAMYARLHRAEFSPIAENS